MPGGATYRSERLNIAGLVATYGYGVVAGMVAIEGLGVPVPGELALLTAAAFAAQGDLTLGGVVVAATCGAIVGGSGGYWVGRSGGLALIRRWGHWVGFTERRLLWAREFFAAHGTKTVVIARFITVLRVVVGVLAGVTHMRFAVFLVANALGGALWAIAFGGLGYVFGRNLDRLEHLIRHGTVGVLAAIVLGIGALVAWRRLRQHGELPPP